MKDEEMQDWKDKIDFMTHEEMARLWRFSPSGHIIFSDSELYPYFSNKWTKLGGMTTEISKKIGWGE